MARPSPPPQRHGKGRDEFYETYSIQVADETYRAEVER